MTADLGGEDLLSALMNVVVGDAPLSHLMARIAATAKAVIEPVDEASITFSPANNRGWTVASTGELATRLDEVQYTLGHGPCLDSASGGTNVLIRDFRSEDRWPEFTSRGVEAGVASSLSTPFPIQEQIVAALNLYSRTADAFDGGDIERAESIASTAAVAVINAVRYENASQLASNLQEAMKSRAVIEQAKGIIMATNRCAADAAFDILVRASQRENRKLREIALEVVERQSLPGS